MFNNEYYQCESRSSLEELSVAALHTVVAHVGGTLQTRTRQGDSWGGDALCTFSGRFTSSSTETPTQDLGVQIKSTSSPRATTRGGASFWSYSLEVCQLERYLAWGSRLFFVLFVAPSLAELERRVEVDAESLVIRKSLYWTFLHGFQVDASKKTNVVYIPQRNVLTPDALVEVVALSRSGKGRYHV